jgi:integrase
VLRAHRKRQAEEQLAVRDYDDGNDLVFRQANGKPVIPHLFSLAFQKAVRNSGLPPMRLHDLRHTHAALLAKAGVPAKVDPRAARAPQRRVHARPLWRDVSVDAP